MSNYLIDGGSHIDVPLSNMAVKAFQGAGDFIGEGIFPVITVDKQSDGYYIIDKDSWLRVPDTTRAPKQGVKRNEWKVSTDTYFARNYAFGTDHAKETLANQDAALRIRQTSMNYTLETLARDRELRIANKVTSISNCGSGQALTGGNKFSDYANSDPISFVNTGHAFIRSQTGLRANTMALDYDTFRILQFHPVLRDYIKYTNEGPLNMEQMKAIFDVKDILVGDGIYNSAKENATANLNNIWGNNMLLFRREANPTGLQIASFGGALRWTPEGFPSAFAVEIYDHHDKSKKTENVDSQYFQDEKVIAQDLSYLFTDTL
jgi:hypothetical protein